MTDAIDRIAAALERLAPPSAPAADPLAHPAYVWRGHALAPARDFRPQPLALLSGIDEQKAAVLANLERHAAGLPSHDVLLWGARGTGKSALVAAAVADVQARRGGAGAGTLALVALGSADIAALPALFAAIAGVPRRYAVFIDDIGVDAAAEARVLRSVLEGGAEARPANARLFVTANRRHIVRRDMAEQDAAINPRDVADDQLALADRFGLSLGFHVVDQEAYIAIVRGYAAAHGLPFDAADAVQWATQRGARSGRVAWQYIVELAGQHGVRL